jgi:hypothetical protein
MTEDPIETRIGNYSVCMDVNDDGDLQVRVYPIDNVGQSWDHPIDTLDVLRQDVLDLEKAGAA